VKPDELIRLFNRLVAIMVAGRYRPSYGRRGGFALFTRQHLEQAGTYLQWFDTMRFAPRVYLVGCFANHNWCYQPKWADLQSDRYVGMYRSGEAARWYETVEQDDLVSGRASPTEANPGREIVRGRFRYEHKEGLCRLQKDLSGGYDRLSPICRACGVRAACAGD